MSDLTEEDLKYFREYFLESVKQDEPSHAETIEKLLVEAGKIASLQKALEAAREEIKRLKEIDAQKDKVINEVLIPERNRLRVEVKAAREVGKAEGRQAHFEEEEDPR